jgi:hypothetical protein
MNTQIKFPEKVEQRLKHIATQFGEVYYKDKLEICTLIYDPTKDGDDIWSNLDRYAAYRIYYYEPKLLDEEVLGEDKMSQIKLLYDLAIETL